MLSFPEALERAFQFDAINGYFSYTFGFKDEGATQEYELALEPIYGGRFFLALYEHRVLLWAAKLSIAPGYTVPEGPGEDEVARRQAIREYLHTVLAQLDEAEKEAKRGGE